MIGFHLKIDAKIKRERLEGIYQRTTQVVACRDVVLSKTRNHEMNTHPHHPLTHHSVRVKTSGLGLEYDFGHSKRERFDGASPVNRGMFIKCVCT